MKTSNLIHFSIGLLWACLSSCGGMRPVPSTPSDPCAGPPHQRLENFRQRALSQASGEVANALRRWSPRGRNGQSQATPVSDADQPFIAPVLRDALRTCGYAEVMALTTELVRYQTVAEITPPAENPEFQRLARFLETWSQEAGLDFRIHGPHDAYEITLPGSAPSRRLGYVVHADIVPVNDPPQVIDVHAIPEGWNVAPFTTVVRDGRLWGRGTEDDKGPMAAAMVSMAMLANAGFTPAQSIVLVAGTAEEHDWDGMERYAEEAPPIEHVISADAGFPVVVAESGFVHWGLEWPNTATTRGPRATVVEATGGLFLTQIPDEATLRLRPAENESLAALQARTERAIEVELLARRQGGENGFSAEAIPTDDQTHLILTVHGRSIHSSTAEDGANAIWCMSGIAARLELAQSPAERMLHLIHESFDGDHYAERLGIAYEDAVMGRLMVAATKLRTEADVVRLSINMRRPRGQTSAVFEQQLEAALRTLQERHGEALRAQDHIYVGEPHAVEPNAPLVDALMDIYRQDQANDQIQPVAIRGGTYARLFPNAVSFGPSFPGVPYRGHGADEFMFVEALEACTRMYFEAALQLSFDLPAFVQN